MLSDNEATVCRSLFSAPGSRKWRRLKSDSARLLFIVLLKHRDESGALEAHPESVIGLCPNIGWTKKQVIGWLKELESVELIKFFSGERGRQIQIIPKVLALNAPNAPFAQKAHDKHSYGSQSVDKKESCANGANGACANGAEPYSSSLASKLPSYTDKLAGKLGHSDNPSVCFSTAKRSYRHIVGKSFGWLGKNAFRWEAIVREHGAEVVISAVKAWAQESIERGSRESMRSLGCPVAVFLSQAEEFIDVAENPEPQEREQKPDPAVEIVEVCGERVPRAAAESVRKAHEKMAAERAEREKEAREAEIEREVNEKLSEKYGYDFPPPGPEFDRECQEIRSQIERRTTN